MPLKGHLAVNGCKFDGRVKHEPVLARSRPETHVLPHIGLRNGIIGVSEHGRLVLGESESNELLHLRIKRVP